MLIVSHQAYPTMSATELPSAKEAKSYLAQRTRGIPQYCPQLLLPITPTPWGTPDAHFRLFFVICHFQNQTLNIAVDNNMMGSRLRVNCCFIFSSFETAAPAVGLEAVKHALVN